jgi:uncharacterized membrane protein
MVEPMPARGPGASVARTTCLGLLLALIGLASVAVLQASHGAVGAALLVAVLVVPLLLPLRGIARRERRVYAWATLCLTPHFVYSLTEIVANPTMRAVAVAMFGVSLALMVALVAYLRLTRDETPAS